MIIGVSTNADPAPLVSLIGYPDGRHKPVFRPKVRCPAGGRRRGLLNIADMKGKLSGRLGAAGSRTQTPVVTAQKLQLCCGLTIYRRHLFVFNAGPSNEYRGENEHNVRTLSYPHENTAEDLIG